jgi:Ca2+-binding RTX toxin-like protein
LTTYTFKGLRWTETFDSGRVTSVSEATFRLVVSDGFRFQFQTLEEPLFSITDIEMSPAAGTVFSATMDGIDMTASWDTRMSRFTLPDGEGGSVRADLLFLYDSAAMPEDFSNYMFQLGGPLLSLSMNNNDFEDFLYQTPDRGLWGTPLLEGAAINPGRLTSLTTVTENDVINLAGQTSTSGPIRSGLGNDAVTGTALGDVIELGAGRDVGRGGGGADRIFGQAGNDRLLGGLGSDTLVGGAGNDVLEGGAGNDRLVGDEGADVFALKTGFGRDTVVGFEDGVDKIDLSSLGLVEAVLLDLATQVGSNVVFAITGDTERLVVLNTTITALQGDFIL